MSLFKTREFWSVTDDTEEEFDQSSLKISRLNGDSDFVLIGSHSGLLKIYKPSTDLNENNVLSPYKANDLIIEKNLNFPILQIGVGKLVSGSNQVQIAILHVRSFAVYSLTTKDGAVEHGNQNMINLLYEHKLRRAAANFIIGGFGGSENRDFIAVQSLDGMLSLFEQETFVFCCFLPNFLLPGPFVYSKRTDSFLMAGTNWKIESFSYKTLSAIGQNSQESDISGLKFQPDWSFGLNEDVVDIQYQFGELSKEGFVVILGERNVVCLSDSGKLKFMKRLEYSPMCFTTYLLSDNKLMTLVVSETNSLLLYQNTMLRWSAQLPNSPISIGRANFKNLRGSIVTLTESGELSCAYLGTQPSLFSAPPLINQELDYEQAEMEMATLSKVIRTRFSNDLKLSNKNEHELGLELNVNPHLEESVFKSAHRENDYAMMCTVTVVLSPRAIFEEINLCVHVHKPLKVHPQSAFFANLSEGTSFQCQVHMDEEAEIASIQVTTIATCISSIGVPKIFKKTSVLPLNLVLKTNPPMKENNLKITLNINENSIPLSTLFPENALTLSSNAVCFANVSNEGSPVTILLAKSSQRYRLQSDSLASLNLCTQELIRRLQKYFANNKTFKITFNSSLPLTQLVQYINEHFEYRRKVNFLQNELIQLGAQFRLIQKRLISKFKDKNPTPLTNLDMLLNDTYNETLRTTVDLEKTTMDLSRSQTNLSSALYLILTLVQIMEDVDDRGLLENALAPIVEDYEGQNWEDVLDASLNHLLRTTLAKSEKDQLRAKYTCYEEVKDLAKLEKHLMMVLERVCKKGTILEVTQDEENVDHDEAKEDEDVIPVGSRLGESSTRLLSARKSLLRRRQKINEDN
ncbi:PREDICTED: protein PTHB1 [Nicrophorus vespilloides]|uniref:Protein PTHB1 n=1 Tax=Nicrophorus vespilloides TaxID=110193 RepID=A0ABM1ML24_NICVS|nr:PREDICTED: protein PTHB1 [Nicrophorus vespilloides]